MGVALLKGDYCIVFEKFCFGTFFSVFLDCVTFLAVITILLKVYELMLFVSCLVIFFYMKLTFIFLETNCVVFHCEETILE